MAIELRPHHLLCIQKYTGHGYDKAFTEHMDKLTSSLDKNTALEIAINRGCDYLCGKCPFNNAGKCMTDEKVMQMDSQVLKICGLQYDDHGKWESFARKAKQLILDTEEFDNVCGKCNWFDLCKATVK